jgi:phosphatidylglycerol:prolipoprotein diacylglycerol transferase
VSALSVIEIGIDPTIELGPITLAWHGIAIAVGIVIGALATARYARELELDTERLSTIGLLVVVFGIVGARLLHLIESGQIADPGEWLGTRGFSLNGGVVLVAVAIGAYIRRERLSLRYLDSVAVGFALGLAVGRIGDVINGEHYGPPSDFLLAVRNTHPDADTPDPAVAFHSGGLYEVLLGAAIFALLWPLRHRFHRPTMLLWAVLALYAAGRFVESFFRLDSTELALGLSDTQWTSVVLILVAGLGALWARRRYGLGEGGVDPDVRMRERT